MVILASTDTFMSVRGGDFVKIKQFKNGNLNLKLEPEYDKPNNSDEYTLWAILNNHDLFINNFYFKVDMNGNLWLLDYGRNLAYYIASYFNPNYWKAYNFFEDLKKGKTVKLVPYGTIDDIKEFFYYSLY